MYNVHKIQNERGHTQRAGQVMLEYAILVGLAIAAVAGMQVYARRGIQAGIKGATDRLSPFADDPDGAKAQVEGVRYESGERRNRDVIAAGTTLARKSAINTVVNRTVQDDEADGSRTHTIRQDEVSSSGALAGGASSTSQVVVEVR